MSTTTNACTLLYFHIAAMFCTIASPPSICDGAVAYTGVNLAGAEFGEGNLPGTYNIHYTYPMAAEVDYFVGKGMNTFRLPFRWERLQPHLNGPLDAVELDRVDAFVEYATGQGAYVVLDPHNYARYWVSGRPGGTETVVGTGAVTFATLADFWSRLAETYKDNDRVILGLMNEPNSMPTEQWRDAANAAIVAIRNTGAANLILVPGNAWSGAHSWSQDWYGTPNAAAMLSIVDPGNNFAFDVHQYLDHNSSGTSTQIGTSENPNNENIGVERLTGFTQWLHTHNRRGFLGEFAVANSRIGDGTFAGQPRIGDEAIDNMLHHIEDNGDVWLGWTWWAAGPWWGDYPFTLEPANLGQPDEADRPAMAVLEKHLAVSSSGLPGDYDGNGAVDAADYIVWRDQLGGSTLRGETTTVGSVDQADYIVWKLHFGEIAGGDAASRRLAVPAPAGGIMWVVLVLAVDVQRRHARKWAFSSMHRATRCGIRQSARSAGKIGRCRTIRDVAGDCETTGTEAALAFSATAFKILAEWQRACRRVSGHRRGGGQ